MPHSRLRQAPLSVSDTAQRRRLSLLMALRNAWWDGRRSSHPPPTPAPREGNRASLHQANELMASSEPPARPKPVFTNSASQKQTTVPVLSQGRSLGQASVARMSRSNHNMGTESQTIAARCQSALQ